MTVFREPAKITQGIAICGHGSEGKEAPVASQAQGENRIVDHPILGAAPEREVVTLTFDGQEIAAYAGEPVAAALLAHGIRAFRTMPENGEPRGLFSGVGRSADELLMANDEVNVPAAITAVQPGMRIETQRGLGEWRATQGE